MVSREARLITLLIIDATFFFVEIIVGYAVGSLALVADSFHMLNDVMSLIVAFYAMKLSSNKDTTSDPRYSYGWQRAEILGALINGVFLLALCFSIFMEAIERFVNISEVKSPKLVVFVGSLGLASNIVGLFLFHDHGHSHGGHSHSHGPTPTPVQDSHSHSHSHGEGEAAHNHSHSHSRDHSSSSSSTTAAVNAEVVGSPSRRRSDSVGSLFGHPAQTRAFVVRAAQDMGYDNNPSSPSRGGNGQIKIQGGERDKLNPNKNLSGGYGSTNDNEISNQDQDIESALPKKKSEVSKRKSWFFGTKTDVELEDDPEHSHSAGGHSHSHSHSHGGHSHGHSGEDGSMNMRGVFLHVLGDALGNVGVIASGLFIAYTDYWWRSYTDPAISFLITIIIFHSALPLVKSASFILLQGVPTTVPLEKVKSHLQELDGVLSVHELHIWQLSESKIVASVHVLVDCDSGHNERYMDIAAKLRGILHQWGIHSATIQPEFVKGGIREAARISGVSVAQNGETDEHGRLITEEGTLVENELSRGSACLLSCGPDAETPCEADACCPPVPTSGRASPKSKKSSKPSNEHEGHDHSH